MVKYKVRIVSKTGTVVPELQVLHLILFFFAKPKSYINLCIPQVVVPTLMAFFQINEQIETNHPCHERNWTRRRLCSTKRRACLTRARMTLLEAQYESGGTTRRTDAEKYAEASYPMGTQSSEDMLSLHAGQGSQIGSTHVCPIWCQHA